MICNFFKVFLPQSSKSNRCKEGEKIIWENGCVCILIHQRYLQLLDGLVYLSAGKHRYNR